MPATFDRSSDDDAKASADKILEKVADPFVFQIHRRHPFGSWNTQSTLLNAQP